MKAIKHDFRMITLKIAIRIYGIAHCLSALIVMQLCVRTLQSNHYQYLTFNL